MARKTQRQKNAEYQKERKRIQKLYTSFKRRGYIDTKDLLTDSLGFFNIPTLTQVNKKATQAMVNALKKITPDWMYKNFAYSDPRTGETVKGTEGRKIENTLRLRKAAETRKQNAINQETEEEAFNVAPPNVDYAEILIDLIDSLPDYYYAGYANKVYYTSQKNAIISVIQSRAYKNGEPVGSYQSWLRDKWGDIQSAVSAIDYAQSGNSTVHQSYVELLNIVNADIVTVAQQQSMDMYEDEEEEYYD